MFTTALRRRQPLTGKNSKKWSTETAYAITSLTAIQARPADLARFIRGHWGIEDRLHWVRDVIYDELGEHGRRRQIKRT